jgi:hypothetical protein
MLRRCACERDSSGRAAIWWRNAAKCGAGADSPTAARKEVRSTTSAGGSPKKIVASNDFFKEKTTLKRPVLLLTTYDLLTTNEK